jgi:hypothetical protein
MSSHDTVGIANRTSSGSLPAVSPILLITASAASRSSRSCSQASWPRAMISVAALAASSKSPTIFWVVRGSLG